MSYNYCYFASPIGQLLLAGKDDELALLGFPAGKMARQPDPSWKLDDQAFNAWKKQLEEYFSGKRTIFDLPFQIQGTSFQQQVLKCVAKVPYGKTVSYSDIAIKIKNPKAVRAVGMANAKNNLPIIVPCHRIIGKNGTLTGFGGGMPVKEFLLNLEQAHGA